MQLFRRVVLLAIFIIFSICLILLLNFTAPNPTGRRYSSAIPATIGSARAIGNSGENVLAADLKLPNNNAPDQLQCLCNPTYQATGRECRACIASGEFISTFRRPDFVSPQFIAESKNVRVLRDWEQLNTYAFAARLMNRPLWVFVRVNTYIDPKFDTLVQSTGGAIVPYFAVTGYVDPVDTAAKSGLAASAAVFVMVGCWEIALHGKRRSSRRMPLRPTPKPNKPRGPLVNARRSVKNAEDFRNRMRNRFDQ